MYMPVPVYSEKNAVLYHADKTALGKKALIITGKRSSRMNGSLDDVLTALKSSGISYVIYDRVEENPSVETVMDAVSFGSNEGVDFVIGIGGGSPLDAAKAVAFMLAHPDSDRTLLYTASDDNALPLVLIPTTCGTGSEVTPISVLTLHDRHTKKSISHKIFADAALVDGRYLRFAPLTVLRNTALDALTHMIESFINTKADDLSRMFVNGGLDLWRKCMPVLENGSASDESYQMLMNASVMGGLAIAQTSTGIPHGLSYSLTYKLHVPHGRAVGYFTAGYLEASPDEYRSHILDRLGFPDVKAFADWYDRLYGTVEVDDGILQSAVNELLNNAPKLATAPFTVTPEILTKIAFYNK